MKRKELIASCLIDAALGEPHPLMGLIDYLTYDLKIPEERIIIMAKKHFKIPMAVTTKTLLHFHKNNV